MTDLRNQRPWTVWQALGVFAVWMAGSTIGIALAGAELTDFETYALVVPIQSVALVAAIAVLAARSARRRADLGFRYGEGDGMGIVWGVVLSIGISLALQPIVHFVFKGDAPTQEVVEAATSLTGGARIFVVLGAVILAPLSEELLFRGVLLRALKTRSNERVAVYGSAVAFAAVHLLDPNAWLASTMFLVLGVVLGKQAVSTGRLAMPLITHMTFNAMSVAVLFLVP